MFFILTGTAQTGKTRWLQALIQQARENGSTVYGTVSPGQWIDLGACSPKDQRYEKRGIDTVLLPEGKIIEFARRADLASPAPASDGAHCRACRQAMAAKLGWAISDDAIDQVNAHFRHLNLQASACLKSQAAQHASSAAEKPGHVGLLVIDELGPLELLHNGGLTCAMDTLVQGPSPLWAHALVVVRESLCEIALQRLSAYWDGTKVLRPSEDAVNQVLSSLSCLA